MTITSADQLAVRGGPKAFPQRSGKPQPKLGVAEFLSIAERFGFTAEALARLQATVSDADLQGNGPNLAKYACPFPPQTKGAQFEALGREKFGARFALATSSGTGALHAAMVAAGVGPGKEVIVPAIGFMATGIAVALAGGVPVFCDIDRSLQIDPAKIEALINPRTVAVAPTHHWGVPCDMDPILAVARKHNLKVIEDCAQSPGATYKGRPVGSMGDIGCYSISAYKIIGGGEGGMVVTSDQRLFDRINQLAECGGLWRKDRFAPPQYDGELFVGSNYRLSELESAVNVVQMGKLEGIVSRHRAVSKRVLSQLHRYQEITPQAVNDVDGYIGYLFRFFPSSFELGGKIAAALHAEGIAAGSRGPNSRPDWHYYADMFPLVLRSGHTPGGAPSEDPRFQGRPEQLNYRRGDCPVADGLYQRAISIGLDQWYSPEDCDQIAAGINKVLDAYCTRSDSALGWL